jgi:hypothetical protein
MSIFNELSLTISPKDALVAYSYPSDNLTGIGPHDKSLALKCACCDKYIIREKTGMVYEYKRHIHSHLCVQPIHIELLNTHDKAFRLLTRREGVMEVNRVHFTGFHGILFPYPIENMLHIDKSRTIKQREKRLRKSERKKSSQKKYIHKNPNKKRRTVGC